MKTFEFKFCKNKYNQAVFYTREIGKIKWCCGYPFSVDGLLELERGTTQGGKEMVKTFTELCKKHKTE